ncbi:oligosaccharide flippase family protein [Pseudomonas sp. 32.2.56]|uniref:oligosaccharide flippase family protein n=1 Tax=Pseudomonas sp. 32.2.56 TaxID=2969303 RepID=UPI0021506AB0|nr:oligosaccharide flippase family protein [Pseudomonas sp. 32.2.56]MCR4509791.1 oligosaccharide flippase family protein [Pseudomonas sp. 32.2.56]
MISSTLRSAIGQLAGLIFGAVTLKILAVMTGPAGVGLFSLFRHLQQSLSLVASLGGQAAIVQGLSCREERQQETFQHHVFIVFVVLGVLLAIFMLCSASLISGWIFEGGYTSSLRWLTVSVLAGSALFFLRGVLNAHLKFNEIALINAFSALGGVLLVFPAGYLYNQGFDAGLVILVTASPMTGFFIGWFFFRQQKFSRVISFSWPLMRFAELRAFVVLAFPTLLSVFFTMGSLLVVRGLIVNQEGLRGVGIFDAAWSVSALYLGVFLASLQSYLLPVLARDFSGQGLNASLAQAFRFALIVCFPLIIFLILFKPLVVVFLFNDEFIEALEILRWTLLGDCVKVFGWVMASTLMARADMRGFMLAELVWSGVFLMLSVCFLQQGLDWVGVAYLIAYIGYAFFLFGRLYVVHNLLVPLDVLLQWFLGLLFIFLVGLIAWDLMTFHWVYMLLVIPVLLFLFMVVPAEDRAFALRVVREKMAWWRKN